MHTFFDYLFTIALAIGAVVIQLCVITLLIYRLEKANTELEKIKINFRFNLNKKETKYSYMQHAIFTASLAIIIYWYTTLNWDDISTVFSLTVFGFMFFAMFWEKFTKVYPSTYETITKYLNKEWTLGVFIITSCFSVILMLIEAILVLIEALSTPFEWLLKVVKYTAITFLFILIVTSANINRINFTAFLNKIYPPIANVVDEFYIELDKRSP